MPVLFVLCVQANDNNINAAEAYAVANCRQLPGSAHVRVQTVRAFHSRAFEGCAADRYVVRGESADISAGLGHFLTLDLSL